MKEYRLLFQIKTLEQMIFRTFISNNHPEMVEHKMVPTPTQMQILNYILKNQDKEIYQKDLEEVLNLRRATVSGVLQTMEKNHLLERVTSTKDARVKKIILNKDAKKLFANKEKEMEEIEKIVIQNIKPEELETFVCVLNQMKMNISCLKEERKEEK